MKIDEIRTIVQLMSDHDLTEFKVEAEEMHLCIKRGGEPVIASAPISLHHMMPPPALSAPAPTATPAPAVKSTESSEVQGETIDSPIVGTFYSASAPDQPPFVSVGSVVTPDTVVCIVEAMKVMNEIKAEKSGKIKKVLVGNAQAVEFGQPLFVLE